MALRPILLWPDPRLAEVCAPVTDFDDALRALSDDMLETMYDAPGRGLAAPQIGVMSRLFVVDVAWKEAEPEPMVFVNPVLLGTSEEVCSYTEGCLSIPGVTASVIRPEAVELRWQGLDGVERTGRMDGALARCIQHELDHLDGLVHFDRLPPAERAALEAEYAA
ncbi:peptide deformylase [Pelagovum pacificum]|uniref:Peptide deformylase n=1 Tax=Pelagovum pacificum TaxID=2588711 RepID=A0A5C5GJM7_9RHOB|nr:peptide deformylase [Pelagovum pacificum]QQA43204.1 peptide deformylase [Pelagovum pacificum]TNY33656.1 peptide deformylase [Pelagovum pacificum]